MKMCIRDSQSGVCVCVCVFTYHRIVLDRLCEHFNTIQLLFSLAGVFRLIYNIQKHNSCRTTDEKVVCTKKLQETLHKINQLNQVR